MTDTSDTGAGTGAAGDVPTGDGALSEPRALRVFRPEHIAETVGREAALQAVERAFTALAAGRAVLPPPLGMELEEARGEVHAKGAWLRGAEVFAIKVATGFYDNPGRGLPTGSGLVLVFDATSGFPLALLQDDGYLTELRTGAAGALAARHLAPGNVSRVAMIGAGVQARFQLRALAGVLAFDEVRAWCPTREHTEAYCREMEKALGVPCQTAGSAAEAVDGAALVVTVTPAREPLVSVDEVASGATVVAVGSDGPGKQELDPRLPARADKLVVDHLEQCARLGELQHALAAELMTESDVYATLGEVVSGRRTGREAGDELVVCDLTGVGVQDAAIGETAWRLLRGSSLTD